MKRDGTGERGGSPPGGDGRWVNRECSFGLHVEYAEQRMEYGIQFTSSLFYMNTVLLNMCMFLSNIGFTRRNTLLVFLWLRPRNTLCFYVP